MSKPGIRGTRGFSLLRKGARHFLSSAVALSIAGCATPSTSTTEPVAAVPDDVPMHAYVRELARGQIDCFPAGTVREDKPGTLAFCETSAVVRAGGHFWVASDKALPQQNNAAIFALAYSSQPTTLEKVSVIEPQRSPFNELRKIEAMANSSSDGWTFASTAFDRVAADKPAWDAYNSLLAWPPGEPHRAQIVASSTRDGVTSSVILRQHFARALSDARWPEGPPYFKIEGLAALPSQRLLFGVREAGTSYNDFEYQIRLIEARYRVEENQIKIEEDSFKEVYRAGSTLVEGHELAVSSLLYDKKRKLLWMLTSYEEENGDLGAYLMQAPVDDFANESAWQLVRAHSSEAAFAFANKAEGMEFVDENSLLVIFDEDRRLNSGSPQRPAQVPRAAHQGAYMLLQIGPGPENEDIR